jgi:ABC-type dipeptide/oligopeptide/nickel transport system permease subunit
LADKAITFAVILGISVPSFFLGMMMILLFAVNLRWLPVSGMYSIFGGGDLPDLIRHLTMPALALSVVATGVVARLSRAAMLEVLRQDFIRTARAKGVHERRVIWGHALRAAMVSDHPGAGHPGRVRAVGRGLYRDRVPVARRRADAGRCDPEARHPAGAGRRGVRRGLLRGLQHPGRCGAGLARPPDQDMRLFLRLLFRNRLAGFGAVVLGVIVVLALLTPLLPLHPAERDRTPPTASCARCPRGTCWAPTIWAGTCCRGCCTGTRLSLAVGFAAAVLAAVIGAAIGIIAGYFGGRTDNTIMRGVDMLMAFPYILLALAIVAALGPGLMNALIAVAVVNIPFFARNIRGITVGIAHKEFVDAARLSGMGHTRILLTEVLPNVVPVIVIAMSTTIGWMILETAGCRSSASAASRRRPIWARCWARRARR